MSLILLFIFAAQVVYVTLVTMRWIILIKGGRYLASALSVVEVVIWVYTLGLVVTRLSDYRAIAAYALGYATGCVVGSWLESKLAFGTATVQVISSQGAELASTLRQQGFGVTTWQARGRDAARTILLIYLRRRLLGRLLRLIDELEPGAVVLDLEPRSIRRGFLARRLV